MRRIAGVTLALSLALTPLALGVGATESDTTIRLAVRNVTSLPSPQAWTSIEVPQRGSLAATMAATVAEPEEQEVALMVRDPASLRLSNGKILPGHTGWRRVEVLTTSSPKEAAEELAAKLGVEVYVENRYRLFDPSDEPLFDEQWGLENIGQFGGTVDADVDAATAWPVSTGTGVVVAVIDSGVDMTHGDLASQIIVGWDFVGNDPDPSPVGSGNAAAHGTMVAGVIAAADNDYGIAGAAPSTKILVIRACHLDCLSLDVADAIYFAVNEGADVINLSIGAIATRDLPVEDAIDYAEANDVAVVAAAGNDGIDIDALPGGRTMIPAGLPNSNILSVAASTNKDGLAGFSNYGSISVDLAAPGVDIATTATAGLATWVFADGTSFSAPFATGVAALLMAHDPAAAPPEIIARLIGFVDKKAAFTNKMVSGGRINAGTALTKRFIDTSGSLFVNAIDWLASRSITRGCNPPQNHRYCPSAAVTRGEMAVFLSRAFGLPATGTDYFNDDTGRFFEAAANRLAAAGLTVGCGPQRYCGDRLITRGEMAAMLARALGLPATSKDFFIDDNGTLFEGAINKIAAAGITQGCNPPTNNRYCPDRNVSRGEMSAFIKRSVEHGG